MKRVVLVFSIFLSNYLASFSAVLDYNANCKKAYLAVYNLKLNAAKALLQQERQLNPENVAVDELENLSDCLYLFSTERRDEFDRLKPMMNRRLDRVNELSESSPYYLYCKAEIYFQWAVVRLKFGEYYTAALHFRKAFKLLEENDKKFPQFVLNKIYLGLMHAAIGVVPEQYKWLATLVGFEGSLGEGLNEIEEATKIPENSEFAFKKNEAIMVLAFTQLSLKRNQDEALINSTNLFNESPSALSIFLHADVLIHLGRTDDAIAVLQMEPNGPEFLHIPYLDYIHGVALLNKLDRNAETYLNKYIHDFKGIHYIKAAYQKLAWHAFVFGKPELYTKYMNELNHAGSEYVDEDKQAQSEANSAELPNEILLRARLLFDGGYYKKALAQFSGTKIHDFPSLKNQLEVTYRIARIYHKLNETTKAINYYQETLKNGYSLPYYFAANASLQLGLIYEESGDLVKAKFYYSKCLSLRNHEYQNSIDQKAKTGLNRVKEATK